MSEWKTYKWGDLISLEYGKPIHDKNLLDGQYPVYGTNGKIGTSNLPPLCKHPSIIIGRKGAYRGVHYSNNPFSVIDTAFFVEPKTSTLDLKWAYYKLLTVDINKMDSGSAIPSTDRYEIYSLSVELPPLDEQRRIAGILGSLDDKIELNRRINANLEAQAQALFINISRTCPTQKGILKDLIEIKYGKDHKKLNVGNIPVYGSGGIMRYVDTSIYEKETVLIPRKGSLNNVIYLNTPFWSVDTMFYSVMKYDHIAKYVYFFLKSKDLSAMNAGSAVPSMTTDILYQMEINIPDKTVFETYDTIVSPLFKQIQVNQEENQSLSALRDTLLPKLMAGEITLK